MERNWTTGSVLKNIFYFSFPYFLSYFLQTLYGMADLFIMGQFGVTADTTAVSIGSQVMHMLTVMIVGLAMGSTVMISREIGERRPEKAAKSVGNTVTLFMAGSILITIVLLALVKPLVTIMQTPNAAVKETEIYLTVCFIGIPLITAYNIISSIFRGLGDTKSPMIFIAIACACNIGLDYLFMGAFRLGPLGAALGTTISQTISVMIALVVILKRKTGVRPKKDDFKLARSTTGNILKVGVPVAIQDGFIQIAFIIVTVFANQRGLDDSAAVGIVEKIMAVLFLVPSSMLSTVAALAAQNLGAGEQKRAVLTLRYATLIAVGFGLVTSTVGFFAARPLVALFDNSEHVAVLGAEYLSGYIWDCVFGGVHFCFSGYFCAQKKSLLSFAHNALSIVLVRIPGSYFAAKMYTDTLLPMGLAAPLGSLLSIVICVIAFAVIAASRKKKGIC